MTLAFSAEIAANDFAALVRRASSVQSRTTIPILEHALLKGDGKTLTVSSTNLDQAIVSSIPCEARGVTTASVPRLSSIASALEKGVNVQMAVNGTGELTVRQGRSRYALPTLPTDDYPALDEASGVELRAPSDELARSLSDLKGAMPFGKEAAALAYLCGAFFDTRKGALVATNGRALGRDMAAWCRAERDGFTLPAQAHSAVADVCGMADAVQVTIGDGAVTFAAGDVRVWTKCIGIPYPDYTYAIPKEMEHLWRVKTADFARALKQITTISKGVGDSGVHVRMDFDKGNLALTARDQDGATAVAEISADGDAQLTMGFAARYIGWAVDALKGETELDFQTSGYPNAAMLSPASNVNAIRVISPLAVK